MSVSNSFIIFFRTLFLLSFTLFTNLVCPIFRPKMLVIFCFVLWVIHTFPNWYYPTYVIRLICLIIWRNGICSEDDEFPHKCVIFQYIFLVFLPLYVLQAIVVDLFWTEIRNKKRKSKKKVIPIIVFRLINAIHLPLNITIAVNRAYSALSTLSICIRRQKLNNVSATYDIHALL